MGTYLNPGNALFKEAQASPIFVDKTEMICYLNTLIGTTQKYVCVSRPRRFGKTMAVSMLSAYYGRGADSKVFIPNKEVLQVFKSSTKSREWMLTFRALQNSRKLLIEGIV